MPPELAVVPRSDDDPLESLGAGRWRADATMTRVEDVSASLVSRLGIPRARWQEEPGLWHARVHPQDRERVLALRALGRDHMVDYRFLASDGRVVWLRETVRYVEGGIDAVVLDVTRERRATELLEWQRRVLEAIAGGAPLQETLDVVCREAELMGEPGRRCGVLLADEGGRSLRHASAPSLPSDYTRAIDGVEIGPDVGSCGAAAFLREPVFVEDIANDPRWQRFRPLALPLGLRACWSVPILSARQDLLGTWAVYTPHVGAPSEDDRVIMSTAARLVAIALERARSADGIRLTEERFRLVARATNDTIWDWDLATDALWWNENFHGMFGYDVAETGSTIESWTSRIHPEDLARVKDGILGAIRGAASTWQDEYRFRRKDGAYADIYDRGFIIRDAGGRALRMVGSMMDVTERKSVERELRGVRHHLELILQNAGEGIYGVDAEGTTTFMNASALRMLGLTPEEAIGRKLHEVIHHTHPDGRRYSASDCPIYQAAHGAPGAAVKDELFFHKDGTPIPVEYVTKPILDGARVAGAVTVFADVRAAWQERALLSTVLQQMPAGVVIADASGKLVLANAQLNAILGHEFKPEAGIEQYAAYPVRTPEGRALETNEYPIMRAVLHGETTNGLELLYRHAGGHMVPLLVSAAPVRDASGAIVAAVATCIDITRRKRAEQELAARTQRLARITEMLARSNRELDQFAYVTSHDLKAPLRGIANLSRWIEEDLSAHMTPETREHLELLRARVHRMEALIDAILEYSRVGRVRTKSEPVDAARLVEEVVDLVAPPPGFVVRTEGSLPTLVTEKARLHQVLMNLIVNAIKHHHDTSHGEVVVRAEEEGDHWRFRVSDNGPGIDPRFHERIFAIFQTLEPRDKVEGTGIGLALVKKVVESYGGSVGVESDVGRGATFHFSWPKEIPEERGP